MSITITEALAEIKTIGKRLEKKKQAVLMNIARDSRMRDSLEGGSENFVKSERQAIGDLEKRIVAIRTAIQRSNLTTMTTVGSTSLSVAEWLTWRREVAQGAQTFLSSMNNTIRAIRDKVQRDGGVMHPVTARATAIVATDKATTVQPIEILLHLDEKALLEEQEMMEKTLGDLDGKLSLLNATTLIEV